MLQQRFPISKAALFALCLLWTGIIDVLSVEVQPVPIPQILIDEGMLLGDTDSFSNERPPIPPAHLPAKPSAFILRWDDYRTLIVIDDSGGLKKGCWIVTLATTVEQLPTSRGPVMIPRGGVVVAYRGQAFYDKDGALQIDARKAKITGVASESWSPDSFTIFPNRTVHSRDDSPDHPTNTGEIEKEVDALKHAADYKKYKYLAQAIVSGIL